MGLCDALFRPREDGLVWYALDQSFLQASKGAAALAVMLFQRDVEEADERVGPIFDFGRLPARRPTHLRCNASAFEVAEQVGAMDARSS